MSVLIYLDVCCLNRPLDDQTQERVRLESEASRVTALLTTDDRLVRWATRQSEMLQVKVANPVSWLWLLEMMTDANP
jgi:hypothetical protein